MIKKLNFLFLLLIFHFVCYGMNLNVSHKATLKKSTKNQRLTNLIEKYKCLSPAAELLDHVEKGNKLEITLSFSLLDKIKALMQANYKIPKNKILDCSLYFISKKKKKTEIDKNIMQILTLSKKDLENSNQNTMKEKIANKKVDINLTKNTTLDIVKRAIVIMGGAAMGFGLAWAFVKDLEFQPATFIDDPKIIPLGFKGLLIKLAGLCSGALMATIVEWENLKNSISEKIKNFLLEKNNINQKIKEWSEGDIVGGQRKIKEYMRIRPLHYHYNKYFNLLSNKVQSK